MTAEPVLSMRDVRVAFPSPSGGSQVAVDRVTLAVAAGERVGLVGESGSGKSLTLMAALGVLPDDATATGAIRISGVDLGSASCDECRRMRGGVAGWIPQEPAASLTPTWKVGFQLAEVVRAHRRVARRQAHVDALALLAEVGLERPAEIAAAWPHQLSGGQAQRVVLAMALAGDPSLLLADEPTTALDMLAQREVLGLLERARRTRDLALVLVSHDLEVVAAAVDRIAVMFAGRIVEEGDAHALLERPLHPYTRELVTASRRSADDGTADPYAPAPPAGEGCRFAPRCPLVRPECRRHEPSLEKTGADRKVRCPVVLDHEVTPPETGRG